MRESRLLVLSQFIHFYIFLILFYNRNYEINQRFNMTIIAISGTGGAGKTTWIKENFPDWIVIHAVPFTRKWSHVHTPLIEFFIGTERVIQSYKVKLLGKKTNIIMDRCFIDGDAYSRYWGVSWIAKLFNKIIFKPKVVYFMSPKMVKAKRQFEADDFKVIDLLFWDSLSDNGYEVKESSKYDFGEVFKFVRMGK